MALPLTNRDKDLLLSALGLPEVRDRVVALLDLAGTGNMSGPASATDNAIVRFDGATGALVQNSGVLIDDSNNVSGIAILTISSQSQAGNGTVGAPAYSFASDTNTGIFLAGADEVRMSNGGTATQIWQTATIFTRIPLNAADGSVALPGYAFENDPDSGIYRIGANNVGVSAGATKILDIATSGLGVTGLLTASGQARVASLGVGNSAAATTPGTVTNKIEVFNASGVSLGFVAVYDAIT